MKTFKQVVLVLAIFFATGEAVVRLDKKFLFFQGSRFVEVSTETRRSPELEALEHGQSVVSARDLRIMVLGDSKLYGPGVELQKVFSQQLKAMLSADKSLLYENILVLDLSKGGYNTLMNRLTYFEYVDKFKPNLVILGNNYEDVYGNQDVPEAISKSNLTIHEQTTKIFEEKISGENTPVFQKVRETVYHSSLLEFIMAGLNLELKLRGIVVPGSVFHHLIYESHREDYAGWIKAQKHLGDIIADCQRKGITLIVYSAPELNMLDNYAPYATVDRKLAAFFERRAVPYVIGVLPFSGMNSSELALSRYDGHANAKGHHIMAQQVYSVIIDMLSGEHNARKVSQLNRYGSLQNVAANLKHCSPPTSLLSRVEDFLKLLPYGRRKKSIDLHEKAAR